MTFSLYIVCNLIKAVIKHLNKCFSPVRTERDPNSYKTTDRFLMGKPTDF